MKNSIKILFALTFSLFAASCTGGMLGGTPGQQSSTPDGQYMHIDNYWFGVTQPSQFYIYMPVDPNDPKKALRPSGENFTVHVWPANGNTLGFLINSHDIEWPMFSVSFTYDNDATKVMAAIQAVWDAAYEQHYTQAMYFGCVKPYVDATNTPSTVRLYATPGMWQPKW